MPLFGGFDKDKCKMNLKMAITRIKQMKNKKENDVKIQKREVSNLLRDGKDELARVRVEHVISDSRTVEALEMLELFCDLLLARYTLIETEKRCPDDICEAVCTIIWAAPRSNVPELMQVKEQFALKYGAHFIEHANEDKHHNARVHHRLSYSTPETYLVMQHLGEIAKEFGIQWEADCILEQPIIQDLPQPIIPAPPPLAPNGGAGYPFQPYPQNPASYPAAYPQNPAAYPQNPAAYPPGYPQNPPGYPQNPAAYPPGYPQNPPAYPQNPAAAYPPQNPAGYPANPAGYGGTFPASPAFGYPGPSEPAQPPQYYPIITPPPPYPHAPAAPAAPTGPSDQSGLPDFDELTARFEALKQKGKQ